MQRIPGRFEVNMKKSYDKDTEIELLLQLIYDLCNSKAGITVTSENRWYVDAESVIAKIFNHLSSIHYLSKGTFIKLPKNNKTQHFFDHLSISTIARVAIETYLTLYYLFIHFMINIGIEAAVMIKLGNFDVAVACKKVLPKIRIKPNIINTLAPPPKMPV